MSETEIASIRRPIISVGVQAPGEVGYFDVTPSGIPGENSFAVETMLSLISYGTESTILDGKGAKHALRYDEEMDLFVPDEDHDVNFRPVAVLGYAEAAIVKSPGSRKYLPGTWLAMRYGHQTGFVANDQTFAMGVPQIQDPFIVASIPQMGPIAANAIAQADANEPDFKHGSYEFGKSVEDKNVVVWGAGPIGLWTALFYKKYGAAEVAVVDIRRDRLEAVDALGMTALDNRNNDAAIKIKRIFRRGRPGADITAECTGSDRALHEAIRGARRGTRVYHLGYIIGSADQLRLGEEAHHNAISIIPTQINNTPEGVTREDLSGKMLEFVSSPTFDTNIPRLMHSHSVPFSKANLAYRALRTNEDELLAPYAQGAAARPIVEVSLYPDEGVWRMPIVSS